MARATQVKHTGITAALRREILDGTLRPGDRLPTREFLEKRFVVSSVTLQRAMDSLVRDGFILSDGRRGTSVATDPPHLYRCGLVFPERPGRMRWPSYWTALQRVANELPPAAGHTLAVYYGADRDELSTLAADVLAHRVAGLIFPVSPYMFRGTPVLDEPGIPRVAVMPATASMPVDVRVDLDGQAFIARALDRLKAEGCRQIAVITLPNMPPAWFAALDAGLARRRLQTRPYWRLSAGSEAPECARGLAHLLLAVPGQRPDGLIIADDNLVEHVEAGLIDSGVRMPQDVRIVAHCNFPFPTPSPLPVHRLGYDMRELLRQAMAQIGRMRRGQKPVNCVSVPPVFAEELPAAVPAETTAAREARTT